MTQSILITGCSTGIGYETAKILKERGYLVFATARNEADVERLKNEGLESVLLDVTNTQSITHALDYILQKTDGKLDALINNAAIMQVGAVEDLTPDMNRSQFETNVFGAMELIRHVLPIMRKEGHGRIIQISSILGVITLPFYGAYNASKFALEGFSHTLRQELHGTNIHVSLINPGPTKSALRKNAHALFQKTILSSQSGAYKKVYERLEKSYFNPEKSDTRLTRQPSDVANQIIHAIESKTPHIHYFVGAPVKIMAFLQRILPSSLLDWTLRKI